jgi:hypothetical protein
MVSILSGPLPHKITQLQKRSSSKTSFFEVFDEDLADALYRSAKKTVTSPSNGLQIDYTYSILLGFNKELYYLIMVVDGIDFIWASASQDHSIPENMILEFLNMTDIKIGTIRFDGAKEFGKSVSFQNFCNERGIFMELVAEYTHVQNAKSENAIRISKEHVRCLLRASNLPRTF